MLDIDRGKVEVPYETHFWGAKCTCDPRFVDEALGDGQILLGLQPLNTRPNYYVIRVDSSWHLYDCRDCEDECPDYLVEHIDEIYEAIEDEYGDKDRIRYFNENDLDPGEEPDSEDWPVLDLYCGSSWFTIEPSKYLATMAESREGK